MPWQLITNQILIAMKRYLVAPLQILFASIASLFRLPSRNAPVPDTYDVTPEEAKKIYIEAYQIGWGGEGSPNTFILNWMAECSRQETNKLMSVDEKVSVITSQIKKAESDLSPENEEKLRSTVAAELVAGRDAELMDLQKCYTATELREQGLWNDLGECNSLINTMKQSNPFLSEERSIWTKPEGAYIVTSVFIIGESAVTAPTLIADGTLPGIAFPLCLALSAGIGLACTFTGEAYVAHSRRRCISWLAIGLLIIGIIIVLRGSVAHGLVYTMANLILYAIGILVSIYRYKNLLYLRLIDQKKKDEAGIVDCRVFLDAYPAKREAVKRDHNGRAEIRIKKKQEQLTENISSLNTELTHLTSQHNGITEGCEKKKAKITALINKAFEEGRTARLLATRRSQAKPGTIFSLLALVVFLASACTPDATRNKEAMVTRDLSKSISRANQETASTMYSYLVCDYLGIKDNEPYSAGAKIDLTIIGSLSHPAIKSIVLASAPPYLLCDQKKRKVEVEYFEQRLKAGLDSLFALKIDQEFTNLNRALSYQLDFLKKSNFGAKNKSCFIISDMGECGPAVQFVRFKRSPRLLRTRYEELASKLDKDSPMPQDLSDISINLIYQPDLENDTWVQACIECYKTYFEGHRANVKVLSNLSVAQNY